MNSTIVFIFKRTNTSTPPIRPAADLSYAFDSGFLSGALAGWEQSLPVSGGAYRWVTSAVVTGTTNSVTVPVSAWRAVSLLSEDGTSRHTATVYKKSTLAPTSPAASSSSYDFVTGVLTPPSGWSVTQPATTTMNTWAVDYTFTGLDNETVVGTGYWGQAKVVAVAGIDGQHAHVVTIYKQTIEEIATPTGGSYKFDGDILVVPSGWSRTMPTVSDRPTYMSTHRFSSNDPLEVISGSLWSYPVVISRLGYDYVNRFLSTCFTYSLEAPATPVEGDYDNPVPTGWSDGIPELVEGQNLWSTSRVFYASNLISNPWSTPVKITNNTSLTNKLQFSSNNTSWHDAAVPGDIYMRSGTNDGNGWVFSASIVIKGESGEQGSIGNPGVQLYTWIAYAFDLGGVNGFTTGSPAEEHKCIGIAHNKSSAIESTNPSDYIWTKWVGNVGETGANGVSTFTWFAYANSEDGVTDFTTGARTNHLYIGMAFNKFTSIESQDPADYAWSRMSALDPASMLETLTGEITASELHADLNARIDLIDAAPGNILDSLVTLDATWGENLLELAQGQAMEVQDRAAAVLAEAIARGDAFAAEVSARTAAILVETGAREQALITEALTRNAAITSVIDTQDLINESVALSIDTITSSLDDNAAAIQLETSTRVSAIEAEALARTTLAGVVADNTAAISEETLVRTTQNSAMAADVETMAASVLNNSATIAYESITRASETEALAQSISLLTVGVAGGFDSGDVWYFNADAENWSASNATISWAGGWITVTGTDSLPAITKTGLNISGSAYSLIKIRIKRIAGTGWTGKIRYSTSGHGLSNSYYIEMAEPDYDASDTTVIDFEMSALTAGANDWVYNNITGIEITLGATSADIFDIDYIAVGRAAPGASVASITKEAQARADAIQAEASERNALATQLRGSNTGIDASLLTSGLIYSERSARITAVSAETAARQALASTINNETTGLVAAHAAVVAETATRVSQDSAIASSVSVLSAQVNHASTGLPAAHAAIVSEALLRIEEDEANAEISAGIQLELDAPDTGVKARIASVEAATVTLDESVVTTTNELYAELNLAGEAILGGLTDMTEVQQVSMAYIVDEREARVSELEAVTVAMELMQTSIAGNTAGILSEAETRSTADTAEANARLALQATVEANQANITTNYMTAATATSAIATAKSEAIASSNGNTAALLTDYTTTTTMTGAIAAAKSEAIAAANGNTATLLQGYYTEAEVDSASAGWIASAVSTSDGHTATSLESYTNTSSMTEAISTAKSVIAASLNSTFRQTGVPATRVGGYPLEIGDLWIKAVAGGDEKYLYDGEGWAISPDAVSAANTAAIAVEQNVRAKMAGPLWVNVGFDKDETVVDTEGNLYQCILTHTMGQVVTNTL
jgi:hypothetical protein